MVRGAHAQAQEGTAKETREDKHVRRRGRRVPRRNGRLEKTQGRDPQPYKDDGAEEVRPDVDRLVVHGKHRGEGVAVAIAGGAVSRGDEGVVAAPVGQFVPGEEQGVFNLLFHCFNGVEKRAR